MTFPLTPTVIVLGLSPADSDACTGTARLINRSIWNADRSYPGD
jgi:hypothetical protein